MPPSFVSQATTLVHEEGIITQWFSLHHFPLAKLRHYTLQKLGKPCELVKAAATRFGTNTLVGERLLKLKGSLQATCTDEEYVDKKYVDKTNSEEESGTGRIVRSNKGGTASKLCLDNRASGFWARVASHVHATLPMLKMLRRFDSSAPTIGKLYSSWFELGQHFETTESNFKRQALEKHAERWAYSYADIAGAAYVLDPEFHGHEQHKNQEVMKGFNDAVEKIGILEATWKLVRAAEPEHVARRPPQCLLPLTVLMCATQVGESDAIPKLWKKRAAMIAKDPHKQKLWQDFPAYPSVDDPAVKRFCAQVSAQLVMYRSRKGEYARNWIFEAAQDMPSYEWWEQYGSSTPELQTVACKILSQPSSASIIERINSEFAFVKDKRRNCLLHWRSNKLVGLFHNLRLLRKMRRLVHRAVYRMERGGRQGRC